MFSALQVEEILTDESMEQVNVIDIQSDTEKLSDGGGCPYSKAKKLQQRTDKFKTQKTKNQDGIANSNLENMTTPLQHYSAMKKNRDLIQFTTL